jgi:hypothetical protein
MRRLTILRRLGVMRRLTVLRWLGVMRRWGGTSAHGIELARRTVEGGQLAPDPAFRVVRRSTVAVPDVVAARPYR